VGGGGRGGGGGRWGGGGRGYKEASKIGEMQGRWWPSSTVAKGWGGPRMSEVGFLFVVSGLRTRLLSVPIHCQPKFKQQISCYE
jgi:hypothetical protein